MQVWYIYMNHIMIISFTPLLQEWDIRYAWFSLFDKRKEEISFMFLEIYFTVNWLVLGRIQSFLLSITHQNSITLSILILFCTNTSVEFGGLCRLLYISQNCTYCSAISINVLMNWNIIFIFVFKVLSGGLIQHDHYVTYVPVITIT